jgi:hypothetical protein
LKIKHARLLTTGVTLALALGATAASGATAAKPYAIPTTTDYETKALLTVGDQVPWTKDTTKSYQMVGIPDGLGAATNPDGTATLFMNHEFTNTTISRPLADGPGYRGAFVSKWVLDPRGNVISGARAYDSVFTRDVPVGPAAQQDNATPGFGRLCSGTLAGPDEGFDRYIYLAGEESSPSSNLDPSKGGSAIAFFDNEAHVLPDLGHIAWENAVVERNTGNKTVIINMEDGPATLDNQLWMYVGTKNPKSTSVLERNGLVGGKLFFFRSLDAARNSEATFKDGTVSGEWVEITGGGDQSEAALESQADSKNGMTFIRIEDGSFGKHNPGDFYFVTTGGNDAINRLGRLYELDLGGGDPSAKRAKLSVVFNADLVTASGEDIAVSPDNISTSGKYLMVQEDGTTQSREWMASQGRDGSIWRFSIGGGTPRIDWRSKVRVAELDPPGQYDPNPIGPGVWETSGIIDASGLDLGGGDIWLFDVQAHVSNPQDKSRQVEDGQLLLMWAW